MQVFAFATKLPWSSRLIVQACGCFTVQGEFGPGELRREGAVAEHSWLSQS